MDARQRDGAAFVDGAQGDGDEAAHRSEHDGAVERSGEGIARRARPRGAESEGQALSRRLPRQDVDRAAPAPRHLQRDVRRGAEAVEAEAAPARHPAAEERAVADDTRAEEGRGFRIVEGRGDRGHRPPRPVDPSGIAAVVGPARVRCLAAEVLAGGDAEAAAPARRAKPGDADAIADLEPARAGAARVHASHDLVTRNDGQPA